MDLNSVCQIAVLIKKSLIVMIKTIGAAVLKMKGNSMLQMRE